MLDIFYCCTGKKDNNSYYNTQAHAVPATFKTYNRSEAC